MQGRVFLGDRARTALAQYVFGARDRCDETVFRFRTVRDARYRYIRNFTPDRPFLQANEYKEKSYPVWNLLKELHAAGKLDAGPGVPRAADHAGRGACTICRPTRTRSTTWPARQSTRRRWSGCGRRSIGGSRIRDGSGAQAGAPRACRAAQPRRTV